jgi:acetylornithine deacetylase/succinyl-diaminopimelate desuccinylase-like protein
MNHRSRDRGLAEIFRHIDARQAPFLATLVELIRQPSVSATGEGIEACADLERRVMADCGLDARLLPSDGKPLVYGERIVDRAAPTLLIYGHYDVQPVDPLDAWVSPPFEPDVRDGRLYARGSADNKGQHLAQLLAIRSWLDVRGELPINVKVLLEGEEEMASPHLASFADRHRDLLAADLAYVSDGPVHESGRTQVVFGARGTLQVELTVRGAAHDFHSGSRGGLVPNAAWRLVDLLSSMRDETGAVTIAGFADAVRPPSDAERQAIAALPLDLDSFLRGAGIDRLPPPDGPDYHERLMFRPTLTIAGLASGYAGTGFKTVIPSVAVAKLDIRLVPDQDPDAMFTLLREHVARHAPGAELIRVGSMRPSRTAIDGPWTAPIVDAITLVEGRAPLLVPSLGGSLPLYVFGEVLGIPSVVVPYGNQDQRNHAPNENLELDRFHRGIRIAAAVFDRLGASASFGGRARKSRPQPPR